VINDSILKIRNGLRSARVPFALWMVLLCAGCPPKPESDVAAPSPESEQTSHEKMVRVLADIAEESREDNAFVGDRHARRLRSVREDAVALSKLPQEKRWELYFELGKAELKLGNEQEAIQSLKQALDVVPAEPPLLKKKTHFELGMAYLRYGETQNCCQLNTSESCIVPIQGAGLHTHPAGSRNAIAQFMEVLKQPAAADNEDEILEYDESARWLMNLAYMTLDEYPSGVPEEHLVSTELFASEVAFPKFTNIYPSLKLNTFNLCGGAVVDDLDGDGDLDVATCTWDVTGQTQVFENVGDGTFKDVTKQAGLTGFFGGLNLNQADFDNDGDLDLFIMRGAWLKTNGQHPNSLLRNDGNLKFTDVTFDVGLGKVWAPTKTAAWADFDNDGDLDLYLGHESSEDVLALCELYRQESDGTFVNVAEEAGLADDVFSMGAAWGDYNNDRYPDLYLSLVGENKLYLNNQDGTFTNVAKELAVSKPGPSFPTWFWDYDNDGHLDIYVGCTSGPIGVLDSDIRFEMMHLYRNQGDDTFKDVTKEVGLNYPAEPMGANFGDLDKDGFPDFYLATGNTQFSEIRPNLMFHNRGGTTFENVTIAGGFGHLQKGHGVSFADIDNDGDQDVYVQLGGAYPGDRFSDALFQNPGFENHSVTLKLTGTKSNRCAIGARVRLDITENGKTRSIHHFVTTGSSFGSNPLRQAIGMGTAETIDQLVVEWPTSGTTQTFKNVVGDRAYEIVEGESKLKPFEMKRIQMPAGSVKDTLRNLSLENGNAP